MPHQISLRLLILALALAEVTSWTIDLPEMRKFIFEKNEHEEIEKKYDDLKYKNNDPVLYSNIEGTSKHNAQYEYYDGYENTPYAKDYGYESYMEKKVNDIVYKGSVYLEGLRRSLENYTKELENCTRELGNCTRELQNCTRELGNCTRELQDCIMAGTNTSTPDTGYPSASSRCREAMRSSEQVRRLTQLATWTARELQDVAYARKYKKDNEHTLAMQENELILKLAWFLDRLAHFTGYEPDPKEFLLNTDRSTTTSTQPPTPLSLMSPSPEVTRQMMECLQKNSSEPAVDRCRYQEPLPPLVQLMMEMNRNITGMPAALTPSSSNLDQQVVSITQSDPIPEQSMELLVAADFKTLPSHLPSSTAGMSYHFPSLTAVKSFKKRSVLSMDDSKVTEDGAENGSAKRFDRSLKSIQENDPAFHFLKYYAKHKVWEGANSEINSKMVQYEVKNQLTHRAKRAIDNKKLKHLKLPENPFQDLSNYIKHKPGVNYINDEALIEKLKTALKQIDNKQSVTKNLLRKISKTIQEKRSTDYETNMPRKTVDLQNNRQKRSTKYEKDVDLPRQSVDPQRDISYYTKNKPGRNYNNDLVQALQVRAGLEQIFNTGNIEVVRRFGANYNPLVPDPFNAAVLESQADFRK